MELHRSGTCSEYSSNSSLPAAETGDGPPKTGVYPSKKRKFFDRGTYSGQIITTSAEVTLNGGLIRELPQNPLNSGLGIILICPDIWTHNLHPGIQGLFFEWFFRKDYCFSRDLQSTIQGDYFFYGFWLPGYRSNYCTTHPTAQLMVWSMSLGHVTPSN